MTTLIFPGTGAEYRRALNRHRRQESVLGLTYERAIRLTALVLPVVAVVLLAVALLRTEPSAIQRFELPPLTTGIGFQTSAEAVRKRERLRRYVFGRSELPQGMPTVERGIVDAPLTSGLRNLSRVDRLTVSMPLGFRSVAYHVVPRRANGGLLIYHNGHKQGLAFGKPTIAHFLNRGYALLVLAMPLAGYNTNPEEVETPCGRVEMGDGGDWRHHNPMACLPFAFRYFLEPVAVALNYTRRFDYRVTAMTGLSGGGWTTVIYAALDPRVRRSYPVAGSQPHNITDRLCPGDSPVIVTTCFGDFEQRSPSFYRIANYFELYTLGGWGRGRKQLAIHNVYDRCCFAGRHYREWTPPVRAALRRLGSGAYSAVGDSTHQAHLVSAFTLRVIEKDLEQTLEPSR
jgi:hypothetical protein